VIFTGLDEVRKAKDGESLELVIFNGEDFSIQGRSLLSIATIYARQKGEQ
jgi:hypothetical protein